MIKKIRTLHWKEKQLCDFSGEAKSESDPIKAITGIGFAGKYPEGGAEEGKEAKPKLSPT